jgi:hypothetical protein
MHSVSDTLAFAVWKDGVLVRSLSLSPHGGIAEDLGERLEFEEAYWAGEHAMPRCWARRAGAGTRSRSTRSRSEKPRCGHWSGS